MYHYVYKIQLGTQFYIGVRSSKVPPEKDPYHGSGSAILYRIPYSKRIKTIISEHNTRADAEAAESALIREHFGTPFCVNRKRSSPRKVSNV